MRIADCEFGDLLLLSAFCDSIDVVGVPVWVESGGLLGACIVLVVGRSVLVVVLVFVVLDAVTVVVDVVKMATVAGVVVRKFGGCSFPLRGAG